MITEDVYTVHQNVDGKFYCKCNAHPIKMGDCKFETVYFDTEEQAQKMLNYYRMLKREEVANHE